MDKLKMKTKDLVQANMEKLAELFPNVITETEDEEGNLFRAVDLELLKQELSYQIVEGDKERYQLTWPGKKEAMLLANTPINKTLRPVREESVDWETTGNLYIEGDNLDVLKILQESYLNSIKCIYIDPPYNTGKDFIYRDNFKQDKDEYLAESGQVDENGNRLFQNTESNGRFHSDWLSMMYPRLKLARNLLREDGVIFISIDDGEVENLKKVCNEIFGEKHFRNCILTRRRIKSLNSQFAENGLRTLNVGFEYVLVYAKSDLFLMNALRMKKVNASAKGRWDVFWSNADRPTMRYNLLGFTPESGQWRYSEEKAIIAVENYQQYLDKYADKMSLEEYWAESGCNLQFIRRIPNGTGKNGGVQHWVPPSDTALRTSNWTDIEVSQIRKEIDIPFDNPKNTELIVELIKLTGAEANYTILDFFSGSATTAHAVMQLNAEDGGNRKYIMVQFPEPCPEESEAYKAGFKNISEIGKERIRRAGRKVASEQWEVISKNKELLRKYGCKELSRADCLAKGDGFDSDDLCAGKKAAEGGTVRFVGSDEAGSGINSIEHSRGSSTELNEGVSSISGSSKGIKSRTGDTAASLHKSGIPCRYGYFGSDGAPAGDRENAGCPYKKTKHCPLTTNHFPDIGFRVFKVDSSNMKEVYYRPEELTQQQIAATVSNIKEDRTSEDLLFQVMLEWDLELSLPMTKKDILGKEVHFVAGNSLAACFEEGVSEELVREIAKEKPLRVVFRDSSFDSDAARINVEELFKMLSPGTEIKVI